MLYLLFIDSQKIWFRNPGKTAISKLNRDLHSFVENGVHCCTIQKVSDIITEFSSVAKLYIEPLRNLVALQSYTSKNFGLGSGLRLIKFWS